MHRAIIIHCWGGYSNYCWYPKTKKELEAKGFLVTVPDMPETDTPKLSLWLSKLKEAVGVPDEELFLIGHSAGCITILRYLERLGEHEKVGGIVLVAGFTDDLGFTELKNFFETSIDFEKIRLKTKHFIAIHSDNDPYVDVKYADVFKEKLGANVVIKHAMKHFSGAVDSEESCTSLPEVSESILEMKA